MITKQSWVKLVSADDNGVVWECEKERSTHSHLFSTSQPKQGNLTIQTWVVEFPSATLLVEHCDIGTWIYETFTPRPHMASM